MNNRSRTLVEVIGICPCCITLVKDNMLYVEEDDYIYHLSCYNNQKSEESES